MITLLAMVLSGKYKLDIEGVYFLAFIIDICLLGVIDNAIKVLK